MILTVSPNVALDRVRIIRGFQPGRQNRALFSFLQPGGSGVHASSIIQTLGGESIALGLLGGHNGELWKEEAKQRGLIHDMVPIPEETRESFCLIDLDQGNVVESVEEGPTVNPELKDALLTKLESYLPRAQLLILSGSLPPGLPLDTYADMIDMARIHGVQTLADLHSDPLHISISHKPWLIKPNLAEFHELIGHETKTMPGRIQASLQFCLDTGIILALSMSGDGLLLTTQKEQWLLTLPSHEMHLPDGRGQNIIGCGDALVGALAFEYCRSKDLLEAAKLGLAVAHYNLSTFGVPEVKANEVSRLSKQVDSQRIN